MTTYTANILNRSQSTTTLVSVGAQTFNIVTDATDLYAIRTSAERQQLLARINTNGRDVSAILNGDYLPEEERFDAYAALRVAIDVATSSFDDDKERMLDAEGEPLRIGPIGKTIPAFLKHLDGLLGIK